MKPRIGHALVLSAFLVASTPDSALAEPLGPATASDGDDTRKRLDIRSATIETLSPGKTRVTVVFWNAVPPNFLARRAAGIAIGCCFVRFWPNDKGTLRVTWGDAASGCCLRQAARHPNPYTYSTVIPLDDDTLIPVLADGSVQMHGYSTKMLDPCSKRRYVLWFRTPTGPVC